MCDFPAVVALLGTAGGLVTASLVALGVAIALNNGFFSAPGSPVPMAVSGGLLVAATAVLAPVSTMVDDYVRCMGAATTCASELSNFQNALAGLMTVLAIQAIASFAAAAIAWIPWAGQTPMWLILGALVVQLALIPSIIVFFDALVRCVEAAAAAARVAPLPLIIAFATLYLVVTVFYVYHSRKRLPN